MHLGGSDHAAVKLCGSCGNARPVDAFRGETADTRSALAMADAGSHATLLLTQLAAALAGFLDSHAFLQVVTDPEYEEGCKMGFLVIASTNPHHAWLWHGFRSYTGGCALFAVRPHDRIFPHLRTASSR